MGGAFPVIQSCFCVGVRRRRLGRDAECSTGRWSLAASRACVRWWRLVGGACRR
nr:MAG TPA: hypothetical protein [Caudoviricetes sp.]